MSTRNSALSRRDFPRVAGISATGAFLAACAAPGAPGAGGSPDGDNSLSFWMWNTFAPAAWRNDTSYLAYPQAQ